MKKFVYRCLAVILSTSLYGCNVLGFYNNMDKEIKDPNKIDQVNYEELGKMLNKASVNLEKISGKEIILVIGKTGVGKSTFVNFMQGNNFKLAESEDTGDPILEIDGEMREGLLKELAQMSGGSEACTLLPDVYFLNEDTYLCDTAGFGETRGLTEDIFTYLAIQLAIKSAKSVKAVIAIVEENQLTSERGAAFKSIAQTISSMFKGSEFHSSFFLLFNKGTKNQKQLLNSMAKMQKEMAESAEKTTNVVKSQEYREIEAVLSIFAQTKNVLPFCPYNQDSRDQILELIAKSPTIPKECLGIATDSKNGQNLNKILCDVATEGIGYLESIKNNIEALREISSDKKSDLSQIKIYKDSISDYEKKVVTEEENIKKYEATITNNEKLKTKDQETLSQEKIKLAAAQAKKTEFEQNIINAENQIKTGKGNINTNVNVINLEINSLNINKQTQINLKNNITNYKNSNAAQQQKINDLNVEINAANTKLAAIQSIIDKPEEIDKQVEVKARLDACKIANDRIADIAKNLGDLEKKVNELQNSLTNVENDKGQTLVHNESYSERALYPEGVNKGVVKTKCFNYAGQSMISEVRKDCLIYANEGSNGYWSGVSTGSYKSSATYYGPSHIYGWANFEVFSEYRHTIQGVEEAKCLRSKLEGYKSMLEDAKKNHEKTKDEHSRAIKDLNDQRELTKKRLISERDNLSKIIKEKRDIVEACNKVINNNNTSITNEENSLKNIETAITTSQNKINQYEASKNNQTSEISRLESLISNYRSSISSEDSVITSVNNIIYALEANIKTYESEILNASSNLKTSQDNIQIYKKSIADFENSIEILNGKIEITKSKVDKLQKTTDFSNKSLDEMKNSHKLSMLGNIYELMGLKLPLVDSCNSLYASYSEIVQEYNDAFCEYSKLF